MIEKQVSVARHEAGHAVAYFLGGHVFETVTILPNEAGAGRCVPLAADKAGEWTPLRLTEWMVVACAGVAAEMLWLPQDSPSKDWLNQTDVMFLWRRYSALVGVEASLPWAGACWQQAEAEMREYRDAVERVAAALLERETLSGEEVVQVIKKKWFK